MGNPYILENIGEIPSLPTWSEEAVKLLTSFSNILLNDNRAKKFQDIMAYAFWIRNASLRQIKEYYYPHVEDKVGRGVAFHIAPSNVPVNFAVSFTSAILAGNASIIRLSSKNFEQVDIMVEALKRAIKDGNQDLERYIVLVRYSHNIEITQKLSLLCDIRIIWGGNETINMVRQAAIAPRTIEMAFADRHSIAILNAEAVLEADITRLAENFYTDTYYNDQSACSSPRLIVWFGKCIDKAKDLFWRKVEELAIEKYDMKPIQAVDKLEQVCRLATVNSNVKLVSTTNRVMRINVEKLDANLMNYKFGGGFFFEYEAQTLEDLLPVCGKACQTISYFGVENKKIQRFFIKSGVRGGDRIVPVGRTMDLTFKWDGYDMIESMSRYVYCPEYKLM